MPHSLVDRADAYLRKLCLEISSRSVGSAGNRAASEFFAGVVASFGFEAQSTWFDCIDWISGEVSLRVASDVFDALASPYSLGCVGRAPLSVASQVRELELAELSDRIALLQGDLAKEQLMPKNFPFYNPDSHRRVIELLELKRPLAIVAATSKDGSMAGGLYPYPLIEDGDFDIPSAYVTEQEGARLAKHAGSEATLIIEATRSPARGCNVIARKPGNGAQRLAIAAHIDAKRGTPGALDNAAGVAVLLLLAGLLEEYSGRLGVEIVALNGEDYYSNPGEQQYLALNAGRFGEIALGINLDGLGYLDGKSAYSLYDCPPAMAQAIREVFSSCEDVVEGQPWYQGDHGLFLLNQRPALAITSERAVELLAEVIHTGKDCPDIVDSTKLVEVAAALRDVVLRLDRLLA